ncbi:MAG: chondroitinase-B domain-containing protein, partial [Leeuwenhoekiella sp.]
MKDISRSVILLVATFLISAAAPRMYNEVIVKNVEEFNQAVTEAKPGTTIIMANGIWRDAELVFEGMGTAEAPITLTVEQKGEVTLEGNSNLQLAGAYLVVEGLVFKNGFTPTNAVISFRKNKVELA